MTDHTKALAAALAAAIRQGEHDMAPTGEELREWSKALAAYRAATDKQSLTVGERTGQVDALTDSFARRAANMTWVDCDDGRDRVTLSEAEFGRAVRRVLSAMGGALAQQAEDDATRLAAWIEVACQSGHWLPDAYGMPKAQPAAQAEPTDEHLMNFLAPWVIADDPKDRSDFLAAMRAALASSPRAQAEPASFSGATFIQHVHSIADGGHSWADEWLKWYSPGEWLSEDRAAAAFLGQKLGAQAEPVAEDVWPEYISGMIVAYLGGGVDDERIKPIAGIIRRRMWSAPKRAARAEPNCTCPSGDGSLRWPCPSHPPAQGQGDAHPAEEVCAQAYQVVGSLLSDLGQFETDRAEKILDNLSQARIVHDDVLPWPSLALAPTVEPLAQTKLIELWGARSDGPNNIEIISYGRAIESAHGIGQAGKGSEG